MDAQDDHTRSVEAATDAAKQGIPAFGGLTKKAAMAGGLLGMFSVHLARSNKTVVESQQQLAEFNAGIARSVAVLEAERIRRSVSMGARTAETTRMATEAQSRLEDALLPLNAAATNVINVLTASAANAVTLFFQAWAQDPFVKAGLWFFGNGDAGLGKDDPAFIQFMKEAQGGALDMEQPGPMAGALGKGPDAPNATSDSEYADRLLNMMKTRAAPSVATKKVLILDE
jgi:hypothetical protein